MPLQVPENATEFAARLRVHDVDAIQGFVEAEITSGRPSVFETDDELLAFQGYLARRLGIEAAARDILIVGSAKTGFSLNPDRFFAPFGDQSDVDVAVVHEGLFDHAWKAMLAWDYLTIRNRSRTEQEWLWMRQNQVWSGFHSPSGWRFRDRGGIELSFPHALRSVRAFSFDWFAAFRSFNRYRHVEIPRHRVNGRLYRTRTHLAMYHTVGLRTLRAQLLEE